MTQCEAYKNLVTPKSSLADLLSILHQDGVVDADLDRGYAQIDYAHPGEPDRVVGVGDCTIDSREVEEYVLARWQKYREPIKKWLGSPLPWDVDVEGEEQQLTLVRLHMAIEVAKRDLEHAGIRRGSDAWRERLATAIFWWFEFPAIDDWRVYDDAQHGEILAKVNDLLSQGLGGFLHFLQMAGGWGNWYESQLVSYQGPTVYAPGFSKSTVGASLFAGLNLAGLDPTFVEVTDISTAGFRCDRTLFAHIGVGIRLESGWHVFDPTAHNSNLKDTVFYPLSLRQAATAYHTGQSLIDIRLRGDVPSMSEGTSLSADGFPSSAESFLPVIQQVAPGGQLKVPAPTIDERTRGFFQNVVDHPELQHPLLYGNILVLGAHSLQVLGVTVPQGQVALHPAYPSQGLVDYLELLSNFQGGDQNWSSIRAHAERLLTQDPSCHLAHLVLGEGGSLKKLSMKGDEVESHFRQLLDDVPLDHPLVSMINYQLGWFLADQGRTAEGRVKFTETAAQESGDPSFRMKALYRLALLSAREGDLEHASQELEQAATILQGKMKTIDQSDAQNWFTWLAEREKEDPFPASAFADERVRSALAMIYFVVGNMLFYHGDAKAATEVYQTASALAPPQLQELILLSLQLSFVRQGKFQKAEEIWRRYMRLIEESRLKESGP